MRFQFPPHQAFPTCRTRSAGFYLSLLVGLCVAPLGSSASEYTAETPRGALYDTRTHYYDADLQKVLMRPQFERMSDLERQEAYAANGIAPRPQESERWQQTQQDRKDALALRRARAQELARVYRQRARVRAAQLQRSYYYTPFSHATLARMTYFDYWCTIRNFWGHGHRHCHTGHCHHWPYYH